MDVSMSELQEMVMDREDWRAAIHGVAKSWTWLSDWTELKVLSDQAEQLQNKKVWEWLEVAMIIWIYKH